MSQELLDLPRWLWPGTIDMFGEPLVQVGACVRTSYGTGPYIIEELDGPCACEGMPEHWHLVCRHVVSKRRAWLNGYRLDGTCVWSEDRLI